MSKLNKGTIETVKTVTIAVLVTAVIAFIGGNLYASKQHSRLESVRAQATANAKPAEPQVKK